MEKKKSIGFGARGWLLIFYQMFAYAAFSAFTSYPQNIVSEFYGGTSLMTTVYTCASIVGVIIQFFIFAPRMGKIKSVKKLGLIFGFITLVAALGIMLVPVTALAVWYVFFAIVTIASTLWSSFFVTVLIGNWFPRRRGTVMGIATFAFPLVNGLFLGLGFSTYFTNVFNPATQSLALFFTLLPYFIAAVLGILFCILFVTDYPEQCGCYRDNDKNMTAEIAQQMLMAEIEAKKNTVWTRKRVLTLRDTWFLVLSEAFILMASVGMMVQILQVLNNYEAPLAKLFAPVIYDGAVFFTTGANVVLAGVSIFACLGSWLLGLIDTRFGTKKAIFITGIIMLIAGFIGSVNNVVCILVACLCLALFMGAASNYGLSGFARYWRREDFASVFAACAPIGCILQAFGPMLIALVATKYSYNVSFLGIGFLAIVSLILILLFNPKHVIEMDNKYREEKGLAIDDELLKRLEAEKVGRK